MRPVSDATRGLAAATAAFGIWGLLPLYMRALDAVPPVEVMLHRLVWACAFVLGLLALTGALPRFAATLRQPRAVALLALSALLIAGNWWIYVWAVAQRQVVAASLGYFINPLISVLLGYFVLRESLSPRQWAAVALAAVGVAWLGWAAGGVPWVALALAGTFAGYGLVRKRVSVDAITGLGVETALLTPLALVALVWIGPAGAFGDQGRLTDALLVFSGVFTAVPLMLFAYGVRRVRLATIGLLQYLGPSLQLLIGVALFDEPFSAVQAVGFGLIWTALLLYALPAPRPRVVTAPE